MPFEYHESDRPGLPNQPHSIPNFQVQSPSPISTKTTTGSDGSGFPHAQITVKEANEYLSYQASCIDRVINQLTNLTNSDNLQSSFVQTLKEQIVKTNDYILKIPFPLTHVTSSVQHIKFYLNKVSTLNFRIGYNDQQELRRVIQILQYTIGH